MRDNIGRSAGHRLLVVEDDPQLSTGLLLYLESQGYDVTLENDDARWLVSELRAARGALTEIIALAHDINDPDAISQRIRFVANRALGLYQIGAADQQDTKQANP